MSYVLRSVYSTHIPTYRQGGYNGHTIVFLLLGARFSTVQYSENGFSVFFSCNRASLLLPD